MANQSMAVVPARGARFVDTVVILCCIMPIAAYVVEAVEFGTPGAEVLVKKAVGGVMFLAPALFAYLCGLRKWSRVTSALATTAGAFCVGIALGAVALYLSPDDAFWIVGRGELMIHALLRWVAVYVLSAEIYLIWVWGKGWLKDAER